MVTPERAAQLEAAALVWDALAADEQRARDLGLCVVPSASLARERTYKRTAEAFRIEIQTGEAVCSCCHKPFGRNSGSRVLMPQDDVGS